jgi:sugar O-acyltransferase (sialic acid O-acetyltransferase NeuD family)
MMSSRLILVGCGAFARELINWVDDLVDLDRSIQISGFLDDNPKALAGFPYTLPHLGTISTYEPKFGDQLLMAIGDPKAKKLLYKDLKARGSSFASLIHPSAVVARTAKLGEGVVICPHALVSADAVIGDLCAINGCASVGHDVRLGSFSTLSAHVDLTGWVQVEECVFFGSGACVLPKVKIAHGARIGAGAVVMRGVPAGAVVYAPPSKRLY